MSYLSTSFSKKKKKPQYSNSFTISQDRSFNVFIILTLPQLISDSRKSHLIFAPVGDTVKFYPVQRHGEDLEAHLLSSASLPFVTVSRLLLHYIDHCHSLCPYSPNEFKELPWDTETSTIPYSRFLTCIFYCPQAQCPLLYSIAGGDPGQWFSLSWQETSSCGDERGHELRRGGR